MKHIIQRFRPAQAPQSFYCSTVGPDSVGAVQCLGYREDPEHDRVCGGMNSLIASENARRRKKGRLCVVGLLIGAPPLAEI